MPRKRSGSERKTSETTQTGANSATVEDYANSFEGRLRALSYAHDQSFAGTDGGELRGLIDAEAGMHRFTKMPDRISLTGDPVGLTERAFGVFALLVHEMMTNAAKYGSLSVPSGRLEIQWALDGQGNCHIDWTESGGPEVIAPTRRGFGSSLIEKTIAHDLGGRVDMNFDPIGLKARFMIPAEHLHAVSAREPNGVAASETSHRPLSGLSVLLVEDQALIAMDTEELLRGLGAETVYVAANVEAALGILSTTCVAAAVLDFNLGGETSEPIADELGVQAVSFVIATGYRDGASIPERFSHVPIVRKPVAESSLASALGSAFLISEGSHGT